MNLFRPQGDGPIYFNLTEDLVASRDGYDTDYFGFLPHLVFNKTSLV